MSRHDDQLSSFLKTHVSEAPPAPQNELDQILKKIQNSQSRGSTKARKTLKSAHWGLLAASLALAWVMVGSQWQLIPSHAAKVVSSHSDEWAAELMVSGLSNDDDLPANQIGEDYLGLMADNSNKPK